VSEAGAGKPVRECARTARRYRTIGARGGRQVIAAGLVSGDLRQAIDAIAAPADLHAKDAPPRAWAKSEGP
jgi:hypothetical protein